MQSTQEEQIINKKKKDTKICDIRPSNFILRPRETQ